MNAQATVSASVTTGLLDRIVAGRANPDEILSTAGLQRSHLAKAEGLIPTSAFARLLTDAARATGDPYFGLHFGEQFNLKHVGALSYVVLNSPSIAAAVDNLVRFLHIHNRGATIRFDIEGRLAYMRYVLGESGNELWRQQNEFSMAVTLKHFRIIAGPHWTPHSIEFAHEAPVEASEHTRVFGCGIRFGCAWNALVFEKDHLKRVVAVADTVLYEILKQHVEQVLAEMPRDDDLLASTRGAIAERIGEGTLNLSCVARKLALSPRTLERRLQEHGAVFKRMVDEMRRRLGLEYLRNDRHTLAEIAFLLGYSEVSALNRAFKRWTGSSPLQYRSAKSPATSAPARSLPYDEELI